MSKPRGDLHGSAPDKAGCALLLIDVVNDLDFPEGQQLLENALPMADAIIELKARMRRAGLPVVYVNDNFGRWRSDLAKQVEHCLRPESLGRPLVERLRPDSDDYFVLKPAHSGFFSTTLELLLDHFRAHTLVLAGLASNICVLFTANDAYQRGYRVVVPSDCVAANNPEENRAALLQMQSVLKADTRKSPDWSIRQLLTADDRDYSLTRTRKQRAFGSR